MHAYVQNRGARVQNRGVRPRRALNKAPRRAQLHGHLHKSIAVISACALAFDRINSAVRVVRTSGLFSSRLSELRQGTHATTLRVCIPCCVRNAHCGAAEVDEQPRKRRALQARARHPLEALQMQRSKHPRRSDN